MAWETVRLIYELSDGGTVEVTDDTPVPMGEAFTHRQLTYRTEGCEIVFEVHHETPGAVSVKLHGNDFVRPKDLAAIRLDRIRDEAFTAVGLLIPDPEGGHDAPHRFVRKVLNQATSRRRITHDLLSEVAQIYSDDAFDGGRAEAIQAICTKFRVTERQAWRYVAQAKERGLIDGNN